MLLPVHFQSANANISALLQSMCVYTYLIFVELPSLRAGHTEYNNRMNCVTQLLYQLLHIYKIYTIYTLKH